MRNAGFAGVTTKNLVEDDLERPRLQQVGDGLAQHGDKSERESESMWPEKLADRQFFASGELRRGSRIRPPLGGLFSFQLNRGRGFS